MTFVEPGPLGPPPAVAPTFEGDTTPPVVEIDPPVTAAVADQADPATGERNFEEEIRALRRESANYRTQLREEQAIWDGWDPDEKQAMNEFIRLSKAAERGDQQAAAQLQELFAPEPDPAPQAEYLTREQATQLMRQEAERVANERDQARSQQDAIKGIASEAEKLGYTPGTADYVVLLHEANQLDPAEHPDLLVAADKIVRERRQQIIDEFLTSKEKDADQSARQPAQAAAPSFTTTPKTFAEARTSLGERLKNMR